MRNSAPGRCRYIRERSQPTASLLLFPGFLSGIRPGRNERSKRRKTGKTRHPVRSGIQSGYIGPTRRAASYGRPPANRPPHATSRPAPKKRDTRGTNGDTVRSFRKRSGPFPSVGRSCGQRSAAAQRCKRPILSRNGNRFPACRYDANKTSQARETNQANNRRHSHRELIRSPAVIRGCRPRSSIPTPTLTGKLVRRQNPTTDTIRRKSDTEIKRHATATNTCGQKLPNRTDHSAKLLSKLCSIR